LRELMGWFDSGWFDKCNGHGTRDIRHVTFLGKALPSAVICHLSLVPCPLHLSNHPLPNQPIHLDSSSMLVPWPSRGDQRKDYRPTTRFAPNPRSPAGSCTIASRSPYA